ncbi:RNA-directed DNA polymerase, eukaryota [Tanacetum coccineum]
MEEYGSMLSSSSKGSIIINGSPTDEFQFGRGLKQGDPLSPFLFLLIMESLHISFQRVVDAGMFHGIDVGGLVNLSHMFYADDAVFIGLKINMVQKQNQWAFEVVNWTLFDRIRDVLQDGDDNVSIGGRIMIIKSVLARSLIFHMSMFKVPAGVIQILESLRSKFFNGHESSGKKASWVQWKKFF